MTDNLMTHLPAIAIIMPLGAAFAIPVFDAISPRLREFFISAATIVTSCSMFLLASRAVAGPFSYAMGGWSAALGIMLILDRFAAAFVAIIAIGFTAVAVYSRWNVEHDRSRYYMLLFLITGAMTGMVLTGDLFNLFVFSEVASIAAYTIVAHDKTRDALEAGLKYLIFGTISGIFVLLGIFLVSATTGTLNMALLSSMISEIPDSVRRLILVCFLVGFGLKAGIFPFHAWLPDAHSSAPAGASAILSGVLVKTGVYSTARLIYTVFAGTNGNYAAPIFPILVWLGTLSVITGHMLALRQSELKRLLAYSTVAQVGYVFIGLGAASASGLSGATYHAFNHTFMKTTLFMAAGIIIGATGHREIDDLDGLFQRMPIVVASFALAAVAIVGMPPLNGFMSKWMIMIAALEAGQIIPALVMPLGTVLSAAYYFRVLSRMFAPAAGILRRPRTFHKTDAPWYVLTSIGLLAVVCIGFGGIPGIGALSRYLAAMSSEILQANPYIRAVVGPK